MYPALQIRRQITIVCTAPLLIGLQQPIDISSSTCLASSYGPDPGLVSITKWSQYSQRLTDAPNGTLCPILLRTKQYLWLKPILSPYLYGKLILTNHQIQQEQSEVKRPIILSMDTDRSHIKTLLKEYHHSVLPIVGRPQSYMIQVSRCSHQIYVFSFKKPIASDLISLP